MRNAYTQERCNTADGVCVVANLERVADSKALDYILRTSLKFRLERNNKFSIVLLVINKSDRLEGRKTRNCTPREKMEKILERNEKVRQMFIRRLGMEGLEQAQDYVFVISAMAALEYHVKSDNILNYNGIDWTEVPRLCKKIQEIGETHYENVCDKLKSKLNEIRRTVEAREVVHNIEQSDAKQVADLMFQGLTELKRWFEILDDSFFRIRKNLLSDDVCQRTSDIVKQIKFSETSTIAEFSESRWNTYKACMRRFGLWRGYDLNVTMAATCFEDIVLKGHHEGLIHQLERELNSMFRKGFSLISEIEKRITTEALMKFSSKAVSITETLICPLFVTLRERLATHKNECDQQLSKFDKKGVERLAELIKEHLRPIYRTATTSFSGTGSHMQRVKYFDSCIDEKVYQIYQTYYFDCLQAATHRLKSEIDVRAVITELIHNNEAIITAGQQLVVFDKKRKRNS